MVMEDDPCTGKLCPDMAGGTYIRRPANGQLNHDRYRKTYRLCPRDKNISVQTAAGLTRYEYTVVSSQAEFDEKINNLGPGHAVVLIDGNEHVRVAFGDDLAADDVVLIDFNEYPISHIEPMVGIDPSLPGAAQGYDLDGDGNDDIPAGTAHGVLIFSEDGKLLKSLINTGISIVMNANESGANNIFLSGDSFQFSSEKFTQYADATVIRGAASGYRSGKPELN